MSSRVLVTGAGSAATTNLVRSLRSGDPTLWIVGCHHDRFTLKKSLADRNYVCPSPKLATFRDALCRVVERERIDIVIPNSDLDVEALVDIRDTVPCATFLPTKEVVALCQDKFELTTFLQAKRVPVPATCAVTELGTLPDVFARLAPHPELWCRIRTGSNARGALRVRRPEQARAWVSYWEEMRGVPITLFTISEYLPGRDFMYQSLWKDGRPVSVKTFERMAYFAAGSNPTAVSSLSALARTVIDQRVVDISARAVLAIDPAASGAFAIDLKENVAGVPCVTEINSGRLLTAMTAFDGVGQHNMALLYVKLALGEAVSAGEPYDAVEDYYVVRDIDTPADVFHADDFFEGIEEA